MEQKLRPDLWKAISAHYERADYTEALRDAVFFACEMLREKSGIEDKDGTKLVDATLMGANPPILVSKNENQTERDYQQGIGFFFKGIMQAIRNPLSHEKTDYSQEDAESVILFLNFLLNRIDVSGAVSKVENIMELLMDEDFTDTLEYAELLLKEVPSKKRYDLLLDLYNRRAELPRNVLRNFIHVLFCSLSKASKANFINAVSNSMIKCKDDIDLRMYVHYFMRDTYSEIIQIAKLRIEDLFLKALRAGRLIGDDEEEKESNEAGSLVTWFDDTFNLFVHKEDIVDSMISMCGSSEDHAEFISFYFEDIFEDISSLTPKQILLINSFLCGGNEFFYNLYYESIVLAKDSQYVEFFGKSFSLCEAAIKKRREGSLPC